MLLGSLPQELVQKKGHEVRVVLPMYLKIAQNFHDEMQLEAQYTVSN